MPRNVVPMRMEDVPPPSPDDLVNNRKVAEVIRSMANAGRLDFSNGLSLSPDEFWRIAFELGAPRVDVDPEPDAPMVEVLDLTHSTPEVIDEWFTAGGEARIAKRIGVTGARPLVDVSEAPAPPLFLGRIDPEGHTILYGPGDVGKGVRSSDWIAQATRLGERVLVVDYEGHPNEWSRRVAALGGNRDHVMVVEPLSEQWLVKSGPLWVAAPRLRELADVFGAGIVVVDSIMAAAAGTRDPYSPDAPALYGGALQQMGARRFLSLAHVNRADDMRYPFGSVFWHNGARTTWSLVEDKRTGKKTLQHRKRGNREWLGRFVVDETFDDENGRITSSETPERATLSDTEEVLAETLEPMTLAAIVEAVNERRPTDATDISTDTVRKSLERSKNVVRVEKGVYQFFHVEAELSTNGQRTPIEDGLSVRSGHPPSSGVGGKSSDGANGQATDAQRTKTKD